MNISDSGSVQVSPDDEDLLEDGSNRTSDLFLMTLFTDINATLNQTSSPTSTVPLLVSLYIPCSTAPLTHLIYLPPSHLFVMSEPTHTY